LKHFPAGAVAELRESLGRCEPDAFVLALEEREQGLAGPRVVQRGHLRQDQHSGVRRDAAQLGLVRGEHRERSDRVPVSRPADVGEREPGHERDREVLLRAYASIACRRPWPGAARLDAYQT
jgi:hypothetical protein